MNSTLAGLQKAIQEKDIAAIPALIDYLEENGHAKRAACLRENWQKHVDDACYFACKMIVMHSLKKPCKHCLEREAERDDEEERCEECINDGWVRGRRGWRQCGVYDG